MTKIVTIILIVLLSIFQIFTLFSMIVKANKINAIAESEGRIVYLECRAYDPYDPFKGRYIQLSFNEELIEIEKTSLDNSSDKDFFERNRYNDVYCILEKGDKYHNIKDVTFTKPDEGVLYIKSRIQYFNLYNLSILLQFNFHKYYIQENFAIQVDKLTNFQFNELKPYLVLSIDKNGNAVQKGLKVENQDKKDVDIEEYLKEYIKNKKIKE